MIKDTWHHRAHEIALGTPFLFTLFLLAQSSAPKQQNLLLRILRPSWAGHHVPLSPRNRQEIQGQAHGVETPRYPAEVQTLPGD